MLLCGSRVDTNVDEDRRYLLDLLARMEALWTHPEGTTEPNPNQIEPYQTVTKPNNNLNIHPLTTPSNRMTDPPPPSHCSV